MLWAMGLVAESLTHDRERRALPAFTWNYEIVLTGSPLMIDVGTGAFLVCFIVWWATAWHEHPPTLTELIEMQYGAGDLMALRQWMAFLL
jgi:hypothetical protein